MHLWSLVALIWLHIYVESKVAVVVVILRYNISVIDSIFFIRFKIFIDSGLHAGLWHCNKWIWTPVKQLHSFYRQILLEKIWTSLSSQAMD